MTLTAWGHVAVFPCQLSVLHHMAPRFGIPIWVPVEGEHEGFSHGTEY